MVLKTRFGLHKFKVKVTKSNFSGQRYPKNDFLGLKRTGLYTNLARVGNSKQILKHNHFFVNSKDPKNPGNTQNGYQQRHAF